MPHLPSRRFPRPGPTVVRFSSFRPDSVKSNGLSHSLPVEGHIRAGLDPTQRVPFDLSVRNEIAVSISRTLKRQATKGPGPPADLVRTFPVHQSRDTHGQSRDAHGQTPDADRNIFSVTLPLPPSINHQYATVQGRRVLSSAARRFKSRVGQEILCLAGNRRTGAWKDPLKGALALDLRFYFISGLRRDIDGGLKITQDAVCEALGINDNCIVEVTLRKDIDARAPRMEVALRSAVKGDRLLFLDQGNGAASQKR